MDNKNNEIVVTNKPQENDKWQRLKGGIFLSSVTGFSILAGFGLTFGMAKKNDPSHFAKGLVSGKAIPESGAAIATRCLLRASLYTLTGYGLVCYAIWKLMDVQNFEEFRWKVGNALPRLKRQEGTGRSEFATIRDLFEYIIEEDKKEKGLK